MFIPNPIPNKEISTFSTSIYFKICTLQIWFSIKPYTRTIAIKLEYKCPVHKPNSVKYNRKLLNVNKLFAIKLCNSK